MAEFPNEERRLSYLRALKDEMAQYVREGLHERVLQVVAEIERVGGEVEQEVVMTAKAALKVIEGATRTEAARRQTRSAPPAADSAEGDA